MFLFKFKNVINNSDNKELLLSSAFAFIVRTIGALSGFAATFFIARYLGAGEAGLYFLAFSVVSVMSAFSRIGLDNTVLRFVSGSPELAVNTSLKSLSLVVLVSFLGAACLYLCAEFVATYLFSKPEMKLVLQYMSIGVVGLSTLIISAMALQGLRKISISIFILNVAANLLLILSLLGISDRAATSLAAAYAISSVLVGIIGCLLLLIFKPRLKQISISWKKLFNSCGPLWIAVVMTQVVQWSGQFMAGAYVSSEALAQLAVAQRTALLSSFILVAVTVVVAPRFAILYRNSDMIGLEQLTLKSVKLVGLFALPVIGIMLIFPSFLMGLFGAEFVEGAVLLRVLAIGQFIHALAGPVGILLIMSGHERDLRNVTIATGIMAIFLTWCLTVQFSIVGAAIGTAIAFATQNLLTAYFVNKRLGINTLAVWR